MVEVPNVTIHTIPVTAEAVADMPNQPLLEDVNGIAELSAHTAITSMKGKRNEPVHSRSGLTGGKGKS